MSTKQLGGHLPLQNSSWVAYGKRIWAFGNRLRLSLCITSELRGSPLLGSTQ